MWQATSQSPSKFAVSQNEPELINENQLQLNLTIRKPQKNLRFLSLHCFVCWWRCAVLEPLQWRAPCCSSYWMQLWSLCARHTHENDAPLALLCHMNFVCYITNSAESCAQHTNACCNAKLNNHSAGLLMHAYHFISSSEKAGGKKSTDSVIADSQKPGQFGCIKLLAATQICYPARPTPSAMLQTMHANTRFNAVTQKIGYSSTLQ